MAMVKTIHEGSLVALMLGCVGLSLLSSHALAAEAGEQAVIEYTGGGISLCGLRKDPICRARVLLVDGESTAFVSSEIKVAPGKRTLRLSCSVKFGTFSAMKMYFVDRAVNIRPGGKYHVQGTIQGDECLVNLIDDRTNEAVTAELLEVKASASGTYPASDPITIFSSPATVSGWTEIPAGDHLIPNSQIYIGGGSGSGGSAGGIFGGAVGAIVGVQIDRSINAEKISRIEENLRVNFSQTLNEALRTQIAARSKPAAYAVTIESNSAALALLPSARLTVSDDGMATLGFRLAVRIYDRQTGRESSKNFLYGIGKKLALDGPGGWSDDHSRAILESASVAFAKLSAALLDDIEGIATTIDPKGAKSDVVIRDR